MSNRHVHSSRITRLVVTCCLLLGAVPAAGAGLSDAEALYEQGDMAAAASLARSQDSAEGFALAAKATLVQAAYLSPEAHKQALFELAAADAQAALARDPNHVDAHLQLAIAFGQLAELGDPISAHVNGYAKDGKALLDRALALDPDNQWALALLGLWHLRVVARGGEALAESLYGATRETGVELCSKVMAGNSALALKSGCAVALIKLDSDRFADAAEQTLAAVKEAQARDAADRLVQGEAGRLLDQLKSLDSQ
jgi:tetratricopeptide (TPR) repeat protein